MPAPEPKSRTVSPYERHEDVNGLGLEEHASLIDATATGFPQLSPMCDSAGMDFSCSAVYPNASATASASNNNHFLDNEDSFRPRNDVALTFWACALPRNGAVGIAYGADDLFVSGW
jgi:hypothetical protein